MFGMLDCMPVLGYDNPWLVNDLRMQVPKPCAQALCLHPVLKPYA